MTDFVYLLLGIVLLLCYLDSRLGVYLTLVAGFLQDPLRKLVPNEPVYYTVLVVLFAVVTFAGAKRTGAIVPVAAISEWESRLRTPVTLFALLVAFQSAATLLYTGSATLAGIGLLVYLSPFPAVLMSYSFASNFDRVRTFLWLYVVVSAAMVSGVYLSWLGSHWDILRSVGEPLVVYSLETGEALELPSGFLRAPEVAAWHAASGACIAIILGMSRGRRDFGLISAALVLFFIGAVMLTGRRKFLLEIIAFLPVLWYLLRHFRMAAGRILALLLSAAVVSTAIAASGVLDANTRERFQAPVLRGQERESEILDRIEKMTVGAIPYILADNGFLGSGAGSGSGGAQYFGGGDERVGLSAEGGLGKMLAEIGVPGILLFLWLGIRFSAYVWRTLALASEGDPEVGLVTMGMAAFLVANAVVFANAHQVYSDPFILLLIGCCLGFILATRRFVTEKQLAEDAPMRRSLPPISGKPRRDLDSLRR